MATDQEITDVLNSASGGCPSFKFKTFGDKIIGTVTRRNVVETPNLNGGTEKTKNLVLEVVSDEEHTQVQSDGTSITGSEWSVWFKVPSQALAALTAELKAKGGTVGSPKEGDRIGVEYYDAEPPARPGHSPKKLHRVQFKPAAPALVTSASDLL
jgi:hypothetical protein